jgi:hypothetical protein
VEQGKEALELVKDVAQTTDRAIGEGHRIVRNGKQVVSKVKRAAKAIVQPRRDDPEEGEFSRSQGGPGSESSGGSRGDGDGPEGPNPDFGGPKRVVIDATIIDDEPRGRKQHDRR